MLFRAGCAAVAERERSRGCATEHASHARMRAARMQGVMPSRAQRAARSSRRLSAGGGCLQRRLRPQRPAALSAASPSPFLLLRCLPSSAMLLLRLLLLLLPLLLWLLWLLWLLLHLGLHPCLCLCSTARAWHPLPLPLTRTAARATRASAPHPRPVRAPTHRPRLQALRRRSLHAYPVARSARTQPPRTPTLGPLSTPRS